MTTKFPPINLDARALPWGKAIQAEVESSARDRARQAGSQKNSANSATSTLALLSAQVKVLTAVANVQYAEWTTQTGLTGFTGFYGTPLASVQVSSPTGRIEVGFGGSLNSGNGYFCYSITGAVSGTIVDRTDVFNNYAQRVAVSGGSSFTPSGFNTVIIAVPRDEVLTVNVELNAITSATYWFGARIIARVAP